MRIRSFDIMIVEIPMRLAVRHALAERRVARNVLVRATSDDGLEGYGESCPRPYVTEESVEGVQTELSHEILPALRGRKFEALEETVEYFSQLISNMRRDQHAAVCAAELAVLDLAGKSFGESAGSVLGEIRKPVVHYSGVVATTDFDVIRRKAQFMAEYGIKDVKIKVGSSLEANLEILRMVQSRLDSRTTLRIDANCAWSAAEAIRQLEAMATFNLVGVEQPVRHDDLEGLAEIKAANSGPGGRR